MWLLDTHSLELEWFHAPPTDPATGTSQYAILSHVWNPEGEQTYKDMRGFAADVAASTSSGGPPSLGLRNDPRISTKIRGCCAFARSLGYRFVWIDSCCIDKTSSAELSEAINSMYAWYSSADVCFAFLEDVDDNHDPRGEHSFFRKSRWFTRGWTLQELIAPRDVLFLSKDWQILGAKQDLAAVIEAVTNIDRGVLMNRAPLSSISVSRRMSWAADRQTTRVEDKAYSLLGIFGIYMPTIYGEGGNAFLRLQEEIIRQIPDQSIFTWGPVPALPLDSPGLKYPLLGVGLGDSRFPRHSQATDTSSPAAREYAEQYLLASSPAAFRSSFAASSSDTTSGARLSVPLSSISAPVFTFTSHGLRARLPLLRFKACAPYVFALLNCEDKDGHTIALILRPDPRFEGRFMVGLAGRGQSPLLLQRTVVLRSLPCIRRLPEGMYPWRAEDVCIAHRSQLAHNIPVPDRVLRTEPSYDGPCTIIVPRWVTLPLRRAGFNLRRRDVAIVPVTPENPHRNIILGGVIDQVITIHVALCPLHKSTGDACRSTPIHTAVTFWHGARMYGEGLQYDCTAEHVNAWPSATKQFPLPERRAIGLAFRSWPSGTGGVPVGPHTSNGGAIVRPLFYLDVTVVNVKEGSIYDGDHAV